jgi:hypothetical protein
VSIQELHSKLSPLLAKLSEQKLKVKAKFKHRLKKWLLPIFGVGVAGFLIGVFNPAYFIVPIISLVITSITAIIIAVKYGNGLKEVRSSLKNQVFAKAVKALYPDLNYEPDSFLTEQRYNESQLFSSADRYNGEDYFEGMIDKTHVTFSELHTQRRIQTKDSTTYETIFQGVLLIADFNKHFNGTTLVQPDFAERFLGKWLGAGLQRLASRLQVVKLENAEFEKYFVVNSSDQIEARYLISTSFMERILKLRAKYDKEISLSFINNKVYIGVNSHRNFFEAPKKLDYSDPKIIDSFVRDLSYIVDIIDLLDLNVRIWSKG